MCSSASCERNSPTHRTARTSSKPYGAAAMCCASPQTTTCAFRRSDVMLLAGPDGSAADLRLFPDPAQDGGVLFGAGTKVASLLCRKSNHGFVGTVKIGASG